jgi:hypothetical protein
VKLRIHRNSLRLRLNRSDVGQFRKTGTCAECVRFGSGSRLTYTLETSSQFTVMETQYRHDCIRVLVPSQVAQQWAESDQISLSVDRADDRGPSVLIEKDFQCLHRDETSPNDNVDAFPNPLAGDQCHENTR